jgi:AcrR family transcriptional regulator
LTDDTELPDEVALLWGLRDGRRRGPKPTLTVDEIVRAAVEVADAEGLAAVSMARVAAQLGNSTMALYRHVRSKEELLLLMSDAALAAPPAFPPDSDWRSRLTLWSRSMLAEYRQHPWFTHIPIKGPPIGPRNLEWLDSALGALADAGLDVEDQMGVVLGLVTLVQGQARLAGELSAGYADDPDAFTNRYGLLLARLVDPRRMPALSNVVAAGVFDAESLYEESDPDADFAFGLQLYLDGVAAYLAARHP